MAPGLDEDGETAETGDTLAVLVAETRGAPVLTEEEEERRCLTETRSRLPPTWELRDAAMEGERRDCAREETEDEEEERLRESSEREALEVAAIAMAAVLMLSVLTGTGVGQRALWLGQAARTAQGTLSVRKTERLSLSLTLSVSFSPPVLVSWQGRQFNPPAFCNCSSSSERSSDALL